MAYRIKYNYGQMVGVCEFIRDTRMTRDRSRKAIFKCLICGNEWETYVQSVKRGITKSCGCLRRYEAGKHARTHALTGHPLHGKWLGIIRRCYYKPGENYKYYGGRGVVVCHEWLNNAESFINYVSLLPNALKAGYSIDRINNDGDYEPGNIRWATAAQQNANKRMNNQHTINK